MDDQKEIMKQLVLDLEAYESVFSDYSSLDDKSWIKDPTGYLEHILNEYTKIFESPLIGYITLNTEDLKIKEVNSTFVSLTKTDKCNIIFKSFVEFIHKDSLDVFFSFIREVENIKESECSLRLLINNGNTCWVKLFGFVFSTEKKIRLTIMDISKNKKIEEDLDYKTRFEYLILDISKSFVEVPVQKIDDVLNSTLEKIGSFFDVDRSYIFLLSDNLKKMNNTHEWCKDKSTSVINDLQNLNTIDFSWWMDNLMTLKPFQEFDVFSMDDDNCAVEKQILLDQNIKSLIIIPLTSKRSMFGFFGLDSIINHKYWEKEIIILLEILGNIISNLIIRREKQILIEKKETELKEMSKDFDFLAFAISHELNKPIGKIITTISDVVTNHSCLEIKKTMLYIKNEIENMKEMIKSLFELSQINTYEIELEEVSLSDISTDILKNLVKNSFERKMNCNIHGNIVDLVDKRLIRILLENLLNNSWKFTKKKQETVIEFGKYYVNDDIMETIMTNGTSLSTDCIYFVRDNGAGFDIKLSKKNLFKPFKRFHKYEEFAGHGIGLSICKKIVEKHNGHLWCNSEIDKGTTFYFTLNEISDQSH